jgi:hypothetical protein
MSLRHRREHMRAIRLSALRIVTITPSSGPPAAVSAVDPDFAKAWPEASA